MTNFTIQIISDTVCPWCYVGYRRLTHAIASYKTTHPSDTFTLSWQAFYLNPSAAAYPGVDKHQHYASKFGEDRVSSLFGRLAAAGEDDGIKFRFGGRTGNTRDSHRVIWYAGQLDKGSEKRGLATAVVEGLFKAYFEEERNITDWDVLVDAAVKAGIKKDEVVKLLESGEGGAEVDEEAERARRRLVTGVPYFTVQGHYAIGGAEEPDVFLEVFNRVKEEK